MTFLLKLAVYAAAFLVLFGVIAGAFWMASHIGVDDRITETAIVVFTIVCAGGEIQKGITGNAINLAELIERKFRDIL